MDTEVTGFLRPCSRSSPVRLIGARADGQPPSIRHEHISIHIGTHPTAQIQNGAGHIFLRADPGGGDLLHRKGPIGGGVWFAFEHLGRHLARIQAGGQDVAANLIRGQHGGQGLHHVGRARFGGAVGEAGQGPAVERGDGGGGDDGGLEGEEVAFLVGLVEEREESNGGEEGGGGVDGEGLGEGFGVRVPELGLEVCKGDIVIGDGGAGDAVVDDEGIDDGGLGADGGDYGGEGFFGGTVALKGDDVVVFLEKGGKKRGEDVSCGGSFGGEERKAGKKSVELRLTELQLTA